MIKDMRSLNESVQYKSTTASNQTPGIDGYFEAAMTVGGLMILLGIAIFILWVWSMISMINLNARFKEFSEYYRLSQLNLEPEQPPEAQQSRRIEVKSQSRQKADATSISWLSRHQNIVIFLIISAIMTILILFLNFSA